MDSIKNTKFSSIDTQKLLFHAGAMLLLVFVIIRWFSLINEYSVNMLYWDQWDFLEALFDNRGLWELFTWQHGPHRQGVGFFLTKIVADLSGWNTRVESFTIGVVVCFAALTAVFLKLRLTSRFSPLDVAISLFYLTPLQFALFANTPNLSHGSVPLLLVTLFCLCWTIKDIRLRYIVCAVINFMTVYTGFGFFLGCITPLLFFSEFLLALKERNKRKKIWSVLFLIISIGSLLSFFIDYTFNSAAEGFVFPHPYPFMYVKFILITFATFCGIRGSHVVAYIVGVPIVSFMFFLIFRAGCSIVRNTLRAESDKKVTVHQIVIVLISFTLVFSLNLAVGRVCLGLGAASSSRYFTYLIPAFFGIYLYAVTRKKQPTRWIGLCMVCFFVTTFSLGTGSKQYFQDVYRGKQKWKAHYLQTENMSLAYRLSGFKIHPNPLRTHLKQKLQYLKENRLNLYLDAPVSKTDSQ